MIRNWRLSLCSLLCFLVFICAVSSDDALDSLLKRIEQYNTDQPQEKVHVQLDKPYYSIGDDIWLKAYVVNAERNELSALSKVLYIELLDLKDSVRSTTVLPIINGLSNGVIALKDSLFTAGDYHLRAYTRIMRDAKLDFSFVKAISIGDALSGSKKESAGSSAKVETSKKEAALEQNTDLQFFPEGGTLVNGLRSKVAFKALASNGLGTLVSGYVIDQDNNKLLQFSANHKGMGIFALKPEAGKKYTAVITENDKEKRYELPRSKERGQVLDINHLGKDSLIVKVTATQPMEGENAYNLIAMQNGVVKFVSKINNAKATLSFIVPKSRFATGIVQFTLFSNAFAPLSERLVFVNHDDQLKLNMMSNKASFGKREKVSITLNAADYKSAPVEGSFSVAVTNGSLIKQPEDEQTTIISNLLLSSDLQGHIEQPNYYFHDINEDKVRQLDLLMLTQGWRRFTWDDLSKPGAAQTKAQSGLEVRGIITNLNNTPIPYGKVLLYASTADGTMMIDTLADANGKFSIPDLNFNGEMKFVGRAKNLKGKNSVKILFDQPKAFKAPFKVQTANIDQDLSAYLQSTQLRFNTLIKAGEMDRPIRLQEVVINQKGLVEKNAVKGSSKIGANAADIIIKKDKLAQYSNLLQAFYGKPGIEVSGGRVYRIINRSLTGGKQEMMIIANGAMIDADMLQDIAPSDVEAIEILTSGYNTAVYNSTGVIILTLKMGGEDAIRSRSSHVNYALVKGYSNDVREFYSPNYETPAASKHADLRSTIYWNPLLVTNTGKTSFDFYTADEPGMYEVIIEGLTIDGQLGRKRYTFEVK